MLEMAGNVQFSRFKAPKGEYEKAIEVSIGENN